MPTLSQFETDALCPAFFFEAQTCRAKKQAEWIWFSPFIYSFFNMIYMDRGTEVSFSSV